jgi:membrane protein YqaA with SNARE-associated domain
LALIIISKITRLLTKLSDFLIAFGPVGLFLVALLDSTFVPLPSSADALVILLTIAQPRWMVVYALVATAGSALGCWILYYVSRRAGSRALSRFSPAKQERVKGWIESYDALAVAVACLLPPPFPFKLFVVTAGVFRFGLVRFMVAIIAGRAFRFLLIGYFAYRYGVQAKALLAQYYPWIGLGLASLIVVFVLIRALIKRRLVRSIEPELEAGN